jgi:hypothetical protein
MKIITVFLLLGLLGVACSSASYTQSYVVPDFDMQKYKTIALLPIVNLTTNTFADLQVPDFVVGNLRNRRFNVLAPADVQKILQSKSLSDSLTDSTSYAELGRWLGADGIFSVIVGVYGYEKVHQEGFSIPYTTYEKTRTHGYIGKEYISMTTETPETKYLTMPGGDYNYAVAEIMISLYDARSGELVFTVLDRSSGGSGYSLQGIAQALINYEIYKVLEYEKIKKR